MKLAPASLPPRLGCCAPKVDGRPRELEIHSMLSLLTAPVAVLWTSAGCAGSTVPSVDTPPLTPASELDSLSALALAVAHAAASEAACVCLVTLFGSAAAAAAEAVAASQASLAIALARSTVAWVVIACVAASSAAVAGGAAWALPTPKVPNRIAAPSSEPTLRPLMYNPLAIRPGRRPAPSLIAA